MGNRQAHCLQRPNEESIDVSGLGLPEISKAIRNGDPKQQFTGCQMIHKLLDPLPPPHAVIKAIAESGVLPECMRLLQSLWCPNPETRLEAAWVVTKMAWVNARVSKESCSFSRSDHIMVNFFAAREEVLVARLVFLAMSPESPVSVLRYVTWTLSKTSFTAYQTPPTVRSILPALVRLFNMEDAEVVADACSAFGNLAHQSTIEQILNADVTFRLFQLLSSNDDNMITDNIASCSLYAIRGLLTGTSDQIDKVLGTGPIIQTLGRLLEPPSTNIQALYTVSRITDVTAGQVNLVINGGLIPVIIGIIQSESICMRSMQTQAMMIVKKLTTPARRQHIPYFCECGVIPAICSVFKRKCNSKDDEWPVQMALETLSQILDASEGENLLEYRKLVEDCGGLDSLDQLQDEHEDSEGVGDETAIYKLAVAIVDKHFQDNPSRDGVRSAKVQKLDI